MKVRIAALFLTLIFLAVIAASQNSIVTTVAPPPDVLTTQTNAAIALTAYKSWMEARLTELYANDATLAAQISALQQGNSAAMAVVPQALNFGAAAVSSVSAPQWLVLSNRSGTAVSLTAWPSISGPFVSGQMGNCQGPAVPLSPGQSCTYSIEFAPGDTSAQSGTFTASFTNGQTLSVYLFGSGK